MVGGTGGNQRGRTMRSYVIVGMSLAIEPIDEKALKFASVRRGLYA
jgi:hypothetical protein